jgi:hypothetical protein
MNVNIYLCTRTSAQYFLGFSNKKKRIQYFIASREHFTFTDNIPISRDVQQLLVPANRFESKHSVTTVLFKDNF